MLTHEPDGPEPDARLYWARRLSAAPLVAEILICPGFDVDGVRDGQAQNARSPD
jgi:hypothetical protein